MYEILYYVGTFVEQLKDNTTLRMLDLSGCSLDSLSAESLAEALTTNSHLEELNISDNTEVGEGGIQHLMHALGVNKGLKKLNLTACRLTTQSAKRLADALSANKYLEELNISGNLLRDIGIKHVDQDNQHLKRLELVSCGITDDGLQRLAEAIQDNHTLSTLLVHNSRSRIIYL